MSVLLGLFCLLLVWAPLPLGSAREWSMAVLFVTVGGLLFIWGVVSALSPASMHTHQGKLWPAGALLMVGMAVAVIQILDLKQLDLALGTSLATDLAHPIWQMTSEALGVSLPAYVTVDPYASTNAISKTLLYGGVFWLAFQLSQDRWRADSILWTIVLTGGLNATIGIAESAANFNLGGWLSGEQPSSDSRFNGTFVNPNHFATFAGLSLIVAMALLIPIVTEGIVLDRGRDIARRTSLNTMTGPAFPLASAVLGIAGIITLSGSRAGTFAMLIGSIILALCLVRWNASSHRPGASVANWGVLGVVAIGTTIAFAPLALRLSSLEDFQARAAFAADTVDAIVAAPLTGNGFGAFESYFPLYATRNYTGIVNAAHNDYLELFADLGAIGGAAILIAIIVLAYFALRGVIRRKHRKQYSAAGVAAVALCGFQASFDFSLQIPAVGILFYAILGVAVAQSWHSRTEVNDPRESA